MIRKFEEEVSHLSGSLFQHLCINSRMGRLVRLHPGGWQWNGLVVYLNVVELDVKFARRVILIYSAHISDGPFELEQFIYI